MHETISKGSRLGVGSLIRAQVSDGLNSGKWRPAPSFSLQDFNSFSTVEGSLLQEKSHTEQQWFETLQSGGQSGLEHYFSRYYAALSLYSAAITGDGEASKEIASEAFVKLWNKREELPNWENVKPLLFRIVYNASIDFVRERKTVAKRQRFLEQRMERSERAVLDKLVETETYTYLYALLEKLPPRSRQIFRMFYFQKKAIKEISAELNISVNTVKTQKLRALHWLKQHHGSLSTFILYCVFFI